MFPILIADDDPEDRYLLKEALTRINLDIELTFVQDGEELLDYLNRRGQFSEASASPLPRLILLDLNMPKMDGREALKEIKENREFKHIPIIVLTTSSAQEDVARTYESGANSYITKPATLDGLVNAMKALALFWFETAKLPES